MRIGWIVRIGSIGRIGNILGELVGMVTFGKLLDLVELGELVVPISRIGSISWIGNIGEDTIGILEVVAKIVWIFGRNV